MNKTEIYQYLDEHGIVYTVTNHRAVYNMAELDTVVLPYPEWDAKNLFVRDDKKSHYYLLTVKGDKRVDLKQFRKANGLRPLSFASAEELQQYLQLSPGAVSPLGLLNDTAHRVRLYLDLAFQNQIIGIHPNDNTATVWMQANDLLRLIRDYGSEVGFAEV